MPFVPKMDIIRSTSSGEGTIPAPPSANTSLHVSNSLCTADVISPSFRCLDSDHRARTEGGKESAAGDGFHMVSHIYMRRLVIKLPSVFRSQFCGWGFPPGEDERDARGPRMHIGSWDLTRTYRLFGIGKPWAKPPSCVPPSNSLER